MSARINKINLWVEGVESSDIDLHLPPKNTKELKAERALRAALGIHHPAFDLLFSYSSFIEGSRGALSPGDIKAIAEYMNQAGNIDKCNLADCQVDDMGIAALVDNLNVNPTLGFLDLRHNKITPVGAKLLTKILTVCSRKFELELSENPLGNEGVMYLAQALKNSPLKTIILTNTQMGNQGIMALCELIRSNQTLVGLHVGKNEAITPDGVNDFLLTLEENTYIQRVSIDFPADHPEFKDKLETILQRNRKTLEDKYRITLAVYRLFIESLRSILQENKLLEENKLSQENVSLGIEIKTNIELKQAHDDAVVGENLEAHYCAILSACQDLDLGHYNLNINNDPTPREMAEELTVAFYGSVNNKQPYAQKIKALESFILSRSGKVPKPWDKEAIKALTLLTIFHLEQAQEWIRTSALSSKEELDIDKHLISAYVAGSLVLFNTPEFQLPKSYDIQSITRQALQLWMDKQNKTSKKESLQVWDLLEVLQKEQGKKDYDQLEKLVLTECERLNLNPLFFKLDKKTYILLKRYPNLQQFYDEDYLEIIKMTMDDPITQDDEIKVMWEGINWVNSCRVLALKHCKIDDNRLRLFVDALKTNDSLVSLNLGNMLAIVPEFESVRQSDPTFLNLNTITEVGVKAVLEAIRGKRKFLALSFELNQMGDKAAQVLADELIGNQSLLALNLSLNKLGNTGICALANALKQNRRLIALDVGGNPFSDVGMHALTEMLSVNTSLTTLNLDGRMNFPSQALVCSIETFEKLITTIEQHNFTLITLDLRFLSLKDKSAAENIGVENNNTENSNTEIKNIKEIIENFDRRIKAVLARNAKLQLKKKSIQDEIENLKPRIESRNRPRTKLIVKKEDNTVPSVEIKIDKDSAPYNASIYSYSYPCESNLKNKYESILAQCQDLRSRGYPEDKIRELVMASDLAYFSNEQNDLSYYQRVEKLEALAKEAGLKRIDIGPEILSKLGHLHWLMASEYLKKEHERMKHEEWPKLANHLITAFVCGSASNELQSDFISEYASLALDILMHNDLTGQSFDSLLQILQSKINAHQELTQLYFEKCSYLNIEPQLFAHPQQQMVTSLMTNDDVCENKKGSDKQKKQTFLFSFGALSANGTEEEVEQHGLEPVRTQKESTHFNL